MHGSIYNKKQKTNMKKLIIATGILLLSAAVFAQKKDTVKQAPPAKDTLYYIVGKIENYQLLYTALKTPGDVTPNQVTALLLWIEKNLQVVPKEK